MPYGDIEVLNRPDGMRLFYKIKCVEEGAISPQMLINSYVSFDGTDAPNDDLAERVDELGKKIDTLTHLLALKEEDLKKIDK